MDFNKAHQKELAKFERALRRSIAETQARNAMYRMPQSTNFTFSDIVDRCNADSSGLPEYFSDFLRKVVEQGKIIEHATGPKRRKSVNPEGIPSVPPLVVSVVSKVTPSEADKEKVGPE